MFVKVGVRLAFISIALLPVSAASTRTLVPSSQVAMPNSDPPLGMEVIRLWSGRAPRATSDSFDEVPTLTILRPQTGHANGSAVIVAPGGGYVGLSKTLEGREVADWFTTHGFTAFLLTYRVGLKARLPIPFLDGARAVRYVRANAARFNIAEDRIGMVGFSAGGHLAAMIAGDHDAGDASNADPIERVSDRLNFLVLAYPWLNGTVIDAKGRSQYCLFAGKACVPQDYVRYQPSQLVGHDYPPTFIYHTTKDSLVRPTGSTAFYDALVANEVPVEMHIFEDGEHGSGLGGSDATLSQWPYLLAQWLRDHGLLAGAGQSKAKDQR